MLHGQLYLNTKRGIKKEQMTDPAREESEAGKFSWWTHVKNLPVAALSTVYDELTGKYSLVVSRGAGKNTFLEEYTANQTDLIIITGAAGYCIHVVGVHLATVSATGVVEIDYVGDIQKIFRLYAAKYNRDDQNDLALCGAPGESVKLTSTTGDYVLFVVVNYRKVAAVEADYNDLTVAAFQANAAAGTATAPERINDTVVGNYAVFDAVAEYCEIAFSKVYRLNKYRYNGYPTHAEDGSYKIQYFNLTTGAWTDWITEIPTRKDSWSSWIADTTIVTSKVRIVATALDSTFMENGASEWEMKYEA